MYEIQGDVESLAQCLSKKKSKHDHSLTSPVHELSEKPTLSSSCIRVLLLCNLQSRLEENALFLSRAFAHVQTSEQNSITLKSVGFTFPVVMLTRYIRTHGNNVRNVHFV